ncbi:hypothetical protein SBRCBS47491_005138 [Sporothrix bragantina]|uniref:Uncharacterized protein n=1 Tax=Sporothrix bragantina TaxID=671064 RepID=A0ABP0BUR3_9PEZI
MPRILATGDAGAADKDLLSDSGVSGMFNDNNNYKIVTQFVRCGILTKAALYQRKAIGYKVQIVEAYQTLLTHDGEVNMKDFRARCLIDTKTRVGSAETRDILQALLQDEVARRAFEGRNGDRTTSPELILESVDQLTKALQLDQAFDEAPFPMAGAAGLSNAFAKRIGKIFDIDDPSFRFEVYDSGQGTSPLHLALQEETIELVRQMIANAVDSEHRDDKFCTPLLVTAGTRNRETPRSFARARCQA